MYRDQFESLNRGRLNWQTEEEVRLGWLTELQNKLAITFHAERGRSDADYNQVISLDDQALVSTLDQDIEHSQLYNRANIHGFVEEPLFSWYIDVSTENTITDIAYEIINSLRDVLIKISFYQMEDLSHARTNDVLKQFYQNVKLDARVREQC